jgi:hypothetical protein
MQQPPQRDTTDARFGATAAWLILRAATQIIAFNRNAD